MERLLNETGCFNGFYLMDDPKSGGFVIIGVTYPDGYESLIDPTSISDDFIGFSAEKKPMYDCGEHVCRRYESLRKAYFAYLQAMKGVA